MRKSLFSKLELLESCIGRLDKRVVAGVRLGVRVIDDSVRLGGQTMDDDSEESDVEHVMETYAEDALFALLKDSAISGLDASCMQTLREFF